MALHWGLLRFGYRTVEATFFVYTLAILVGARHSYGAGLMVTALVIGVLPFLFQPAFSVSQINYVGLAVFALVSVVVSRTSAARARAQRALRDLNAGLEARVEQQTAELRTLLAREQTARAEADAANLVKDEFLATLSHELRTPLSAMLGWAQLLQSGKVTGTQADSALAAIERNAKVQARLIEEVLDLSRMVSGKLKIDLQPVDPATVVASAVESVAPAAAAKGIQFDVDCTTTAERVLADPDRLLQVVWNLLSNAIKFTPAGGRVTVALARVSGSVEVKVSDTGMGISPAFLPHVFERFRQADGSFSRSHSGLGIGLAIVRHVIEIHGGTVRAHSDGEGRGATFTIQLPRLVTAGQPSASTPRSPLIDARNKLASLGLRVLVVEDQPDTLELITTLLRQSGVEVVTTTSAAEALETFAARRPDLVVSDLGMPGQDGLQFIRAVRELERTSGRPAVPALALTAYARPADRDRALEAGFHAHLPKPIDPSELLSVVYALGGPPVRPTSAP